jgi:hydrogenase maturation factor
MFNFESKVKDLSITFVDVKGITRDVSLRDILSIISNDSYVAVEVGNEQDYHVIEIEVGTALFINMIRDRLKGLWL